MRYLLRVLASHAHDYPGRWPWSRCAHTGCPALRGVR